MSDHEHDHGDHDHEHDDGAELDADDEAAREQEVRRRIALAQVRQYGDPALRMRAGEVETFDDELARLAERMTSIMHDAEGVGLAATQVGILKRLFVFHDDGEDRVVVNPVVTARAGRATDEEGCLSLGTVRVPVERDVELTLEGQGLDGSPVVLELSELPARVVQHELDHLDGVLIIDRTEDVEARREALRRLRPRLAL